MMKILSYRTGPAGRPAPTTGFSLIELMIVIALIAIISSIAMPSYQRNVLKTRRAEAFGQLLRLQSNYETAYSQNNSYPTMGPSPIPNSTHYIYSSAIGNSVSSNTGYTLTATAKTSSSQASDAEGSTSCSTLTLDNLGAKGSNPVCWPE